MMLPSFRRGRFAPGVILGLALASPTYAVPQAGSDGAPRPIPLREVPAQDPNPQPGQAPGFDVRAWGARLEDPDLDRRQLAFDELARLARRDPAAREAIAAWAADSARGELAWTARLLERELGSGRRAGWPFGAARPAPSVPRDPWEELFGDGDGAGPFGRGFRDLHMHFGDPFADLEARLRELERHFAGPTAPRSPGSPGVPSAPPVPFSSGRSVSVEVGPDGVNVRLRTQEDGQERVEEYRARSLEELLEQHPELAEHLGHLGPRPARPGTGQRAPDRPLLGIQYEPVDGARAAQLGLGADQGLAVVSVVPGSLAERLDLSPGDVLFELEGRAVGNAQDVQAALRERRSDAPVTARAYAPDGSLRELREARRPRALEGLGTRRM